MLLKRNVLYVMSGLPGAGKSYLLRQIPKFMVVSSDQIRLSICESTIYKNENKNTKKHISQESNEVVFSIMRQLVEEKCKLGLTTFVDATNLTDSDRKQWFDIAKKYSMECEIIILNIDLEEILLNNRSRTNEVPESVIYRMNENFQKDSKFPYRVTKYSLEEQINLYSESIQEENLDIVGDVHGLYNEMIELIEKLGYSIEKGKVIHQDNRKLVFLGDFIDRGEYSIEVLKFVKMAVEQGHYAVIGNHEEKLINSYEKIKNGREIMGGLSGKITLSNLLREPLKIQESLISFLKKLPFYLVHEYSNTLLVHADILNGNLDTLTKQEAIYGFSRKGEKQNTDAQYQLLYNKGIVKYRLIRGHIAAMSIEKDVISLEGEQAFNGHILAMSIDNTEWGEISSVSCDFNYNNHVAGNYLFKINDLVKNKLITTKVHEGLLICKYSKSVFFKNLWNQDPFLLKSRGLVLDYAGNIVQHPFDKIFNYLENGAGANILDDKNVVYVEKYNGFLGNIGLNPITKKLLITTTGSFDSDFVNYVKDFITPELNHALLKFLNNDPMTLSFEVLHPKDPHIIEYKPEDMGLVLIGARRLNYDSHSLTEFELDLISEKFEFKRSKWNVAKFGLVKKMVESSELEGFIIRDYDCPKETPLLKFKTPYYLVTKFLARMSEGNINFMYSNADKFKESVDEEFYPLVDYIIKNISQEEFKSMDKNEKTQYIRAIISFIRSYE